MTTAVRVENLTVERGGHTALRDVSVEIPAGEITGLLGPSGCGKTTLIRSIVGTQIVRSGSVRVLGAAAGSPALRTRVGYVTQSPSIYADLTVEGNVAYFASLYGRRRSDVHEAIEAVGLADRRTAVAAELSGGQEGRVSLACALVGRPELLVLDEPTVGLDPLLRADLWDRFARLAAEGTTLVVSSHVMDEADHCSSLLLMRDGELLAHLTPNELREHTGTTSLDDAFLALVREGAPGTGSSTDGSR
ncbi:ABC transporter ATP-binding protein [Rhodococcus rhodnii]|uniref:ABC transporter n=2 Tax=Rhodococcus rhodnii TaxID=38312 RepID=R7WT73_9NOCA|nr:ABC transporter ATP-binding protein [Rhodococcus rhodnii]EOM78481.1 ABC transporter [Rhodococcus rhodnii LMG 5362]TXG91280.1 ABC transporter ATP-binding protein [Rhodococcus rhodnii]